MHETGNSQKNFRLLILNAYFNVLYLLLTAYGVLQSPKLVCFLRVVFLFIYSFHFEIVTV